MSFEFKEFTEQEKQKSKDQLIGKYIFESNENIGEIEEKDVVRSDTLEGKVRIIPPGRPVTKDYLPFRMNVYIDENKKVTNVNFG
ncbi:unnamed protein product [Cunninghamella blakesleeana]